MFKIKILKEIVITFLILFALACNNTHNKKDVTNTSTTDKKVSEKSITTKSELKTRESIVKEILTTSPRYKQLTNGLYEIVIKNGGSSIGVRLEGSPNPKNDKTSNYSKTYDFTLYEMYPDRQLSTVRFTFNPDNMQLYEYDAVNDSLKSIEFDHNLLLAFENLANNP